MMTERYKMSKVFELNKPYPIFEGNEALTQEEVTNRLNQYEYENQTLKEKVKELLTESLKITDLSDKHKIVEMTNQVLIQFIKSKGHSLEEVTRFVKEEL